MTLAQEKQRRPPHPDSVRIEAVRLHAEEEMPAKEIGWRLGVPKRTVFTWLNPGLAERSRRSALEAKRRQTGRCEDCGAVTRYNGHRVPVSRFCHACAAARAGIARRGKGIRISAAIKILEECQPVRYMELRDRLGLNNSNTQALLYGRLIPHGYARRVSRGLYVAGPALDKT